MHRRKDFLKLTSAPFGGMIDSLPPFSERAALRGGLFRIRKACFNGNKLATNKPKNRIKQAFDGYTADKSDVNSRMPLK